MCWVLLYDLHILYLSNLHNNRVRSVLLLPLFVCEKAKILEWLNCLKCSQNRNPDSLTLEFYNTPVRPWKDEGVEDNCPALKEMIAYSKKHGVLFPF